MVFTEITWIVGMFVTLTAAIVTSYHWLDNKKADKREVDHIMKAIDEIKVDIKEILKISK